MRLILVYIFIALIVSDSAQEMAPPVYKQFVRFIYFQNLLLDRHAASIEELSNPQ